MRSGSVVRRLVELTWSRLVELGCDADELSGRVSFVPPRAGARAAMHRRAPYEHLCELVEAGAQLSEDPLIGVRLSLPLDPRTGGLLALLMLACSDVRAALQRLVRYQRIAFDAYRVEFEEHSLCVRFPDERPAVPHLASWFVEDTLRGIETLCGERPIPRHVALPGAIDEVTLSTTFGCAVEAGAPNVRIEFDDHTLRRPLRHANAHFRGALEHEVALLAARIPSLRRWSELVRSTLEEELVRTPTLVSVAARVGVAPRTLQRRLHAEGTSVESLLEELRRDRAVELLRREVDIAEISYRLGYASPSSFHRAFRRWYGTTPAAYGAERSES